MVIIEFGYSTKFVLPYDDGIELMSKFKNAEEWNSDDYKNPTIKPLESSPTLTLLSKEKYQEMKTLHLLGLPKDNDKDKI